MMARNRYESPTESIHEPIKAVGKASVAAIPVLGGFTVELIGYHENHLNRARMRKFLDRIGQAITDLERWKENLPRDEPLKSTLLEAAEIAVRSHENEKLEALKNAVLNVHMSASVDEYHRSRFMALISRYSALHLRVMKILAEPQKLTDLDCVQEEVRKIHERNHGPSPQHALPVHVNVDALLIEKFGPPYKGAVYQILSEMASDHLIGNARGKMKIQPAQPYLKKFGQEFLNFVSASRSPEPLDD